jgi:hypothetical protein
MRRTYKFKISSVRKGRFGLLSVCMLELKFTRRSFVDVALLFQMGRGWSADVKSACCFTDNVMDDKFCREDNIHGFIMFSCWERPLALRFG